MFVLVKDGEKFGILGVGRSRTGTDWAVNKFGLYYLFNAEHVGRIKSGYVAFMNSMGSVVAAAPVQDVAANVEHVPPYNGEFGPYWWVDKEFKLAASCAVASEQEAF